jgi:F420 biosynthesis protein FbiB-like protein
MSAKDELTRPGNPKQENRPHCRKMDRTGLADDNLPKFRFDETCALLGQRRSIRRYLTKPVSDSLIKEVLTAATFAPSAHNRQPWRFVLIQDPGTKSRFARMMGDRLRVDRTKDGDAPHVIAKDVLNSIERITSAPVVLVVCMTTEDMDVYSDARRAAAERHMAVQSVAMAMQNMLIAAHAASLGSSVMCAPLFCPDTVRSALDLPLQWEPQALVTMGYPANSGKPFARRALIDVLRVVPTGP